MVAVGGDGDGDGSDRSVCVCIRLGFYLVMISGKRLVKPVFCWS